MGIDLLLLHLLNRPGLGALDAVMIALSSRWFLLPLLAAFALWLWLRTGAGWRGALVLVVSVVATDLLNSRAIKPLIDRPRPCAGKAPTSLAIQGCGRGRSFPTSHAATAGAAAMGVAMAAPPLAVPAALIALLVGVSRIYLGQHWPSDVLGGWVLGALLGGAAMWVARPRRKRATLA